MKYDRVSICEFDIFVKFKFFKFENLFEFYDTNISNRITSQIIQVRVFQVSFLFKFFHFKFFEFNKFNKFNKFIKI